MRLRSRRLRYDLPNQAERAALVRRGLGLNYATIGYNALEAVVALAGIALNAFIGWWRADPVGALAMVPIIVREAVEGVTGRECGVRSLAPVHHRRRRYARIGKSTPWTAERIPCCRSPFA